MSLVLYFHPLSSFCHKALIALYERGVPFEKIIVDLGDQKSRDAFEAVWPLLKFPVLRDETRDQTVAESTSIIDYLDTFHPGTGPLIPKGSDAAWQARMWDRIFDHYVHHPMQRIVAEALRPQTSRDAHGVDAARTQLRKAYDFLESRIATGPWCTGDDFTLADCSAAPALFYANTVLPFGAEQVKLARYLGRLMERPSFARVLSEAQPYFELFPLNPKPTISRP
jgi:glutathione S-transferase